MLEGCVNAADSQEQVIITEKAGRREFVDV